MDSIHIKGDFDAEQIKKEIKNVENQIQKLNNKKLKLTSEYEVLTEKIAEARNQIAAYDGELKNAISSEDRLRSKRSKGKAEANLNEYLAQLQDIQNEMTIIDRQLDSLENQRISLKFDGAKADKSVSTFKSKMEASLKSVEKSFGNFGKRISNTFKSALIFSVLYSGINKLKQLMGSALGTNQQFTNSLNQIKSNLAIAFMPVYQAILPGLNALMSALAKATAFLAAFTNALFGTSVSSSAAAANEMQSAINAVESGASGATAAEKQLTAAIKEKQKQVKALQRENKQLQREYEQQKKAVEAQTAEIEKQISAYEKSIDSINQMQDAANKAAEAQREAIQNSIDLLEAQQEAIQKRSQAQQKALEKEIKALQKQQKQMQKQYKAQNDVIDEQINNIKSQQEQLNDEYDKQNEGIDSQIKALEAEIKALEKAKKAAEEAEKANQKFTAGFDELSTLDSGDSDNPYDAEIDKIQEKIDALEEEKEKHAEVYEAENKKLEEQIELLQSEKETLSEVYEQQRESIQENIEGLQEEKEAIAEKYDAQNEKIQEQIDLLQKQQEAIKDTDYSSGIEAYESRIAKLREKIDELNDSVKENPLIEQNELLIEKLQEEIDLLQEQKDALETTGNAGSNAFGNFSEQIEKMREKIEASPLFKWLSDNKDEVKLFAENIAILTGAVMGVYGAFKLFSTILTVLTSPITIITGLIAYLVIISGNGEEVVNHLKDALKHFGDAMKQFVSGDFENAKKSLTKGMYALGNACISIFEGICNGVAKAINWIIEKINQWIAELPDDGFLKKEVFGDYQIAWRADENAVSFPRLEVPALAAGAVLPPNKPFMAWVGDQKNGTNIEAPLSTIEDAMRTVMGEQEYNFNINATGSMGAFIRLLKLQIERENNRSTAF